MNWIDPDNWVDLIAYGWYGLVLIAVAAVPSLLAARNHGAIKKLGQQTETLEAIKTQGVNGHESPMRADLDRVIVSIDRLGQSIANLRSELADEHATRREQIRELREDVDARLSTLHSRLG